MSLAAMFLCHLYTRPCDRYRGVFSAFGTFYRHRPSFLLELIFVLLGCDYDGWKRAFYYKPERREAN